MSWKDVALTMESRVEQLKDDNKELIKQVELLTAQKVALIEYIKNPPQPSEETKRINEYWKGYNER